MYVGHVLLQLLPNFVQNHPFDFLGRLALHVIVCQSICALTQPDVRSYLHIGHLLLVLFIGEKTLNIFALFFRRLGSES